MQRAGFMPVFCVVSLCRQNSRTVRPERGILWDRRMEPEAYVLSGLKSFPDAREICYTDTVGFYGRFLSIKKA